MLSHEFEAGLETDCKTVDRPPKGPRRLRWAAVIVLCLLPAVIALAYIRAYGVSVVFWDEWALVPLFEKYDQGTLTFRDFYAQHNEHRLFFPRLAMLGLGLATHYNTVAEMVAGWGFLCAGGLAIYASHRRRYADSLRASALFIPVAWLLFSLRQSENFLWGWQMLFFMALAFVLWTLCFIERMRGLDRWLAAAAGAGIVATFSFSSALFLWPIGLMATLMNRPATPDKALSRILSGAVWGMIGALAWVAYFTGYTKPGHHPSLLYTVCYPGEFFQYLCLYLANPLGIEGRGEVVCGAILLAAYFGGLVWAWLRWRKGAELPILPFSLLLFTLGTALITSLARAGLGPEQALSERYITFSGLGLIGLYLTVLDFEPWRRLWPVAPASSPAVQGASCPLSLRRRDASGPAAETAALQSEAAEPHNIMGRATSRQTPTGALIVVTRALPLALCAAFALLVFHLYDPVAGRKTREARAQMARVLATVNSQSDQALLPMYFDPAVVRRDAEVLRRHNLNVFAESAPGAQ